MTLHRKKKKRKSCNSKRVATTSNIQQVSHILSNYRQWQNKGPKPGPRENYFFSTLSKSNSYAALPKIGFNDRI